jgi:hypothetical protein
VRDFPSGERVFVWLFSCLPAVFLLGAFIYGLVLVVKTHRRVESMAERLEDIERKLDLE